VAQEVSERLDVAHAADEHLLVVAVEDPHFAALLPLARERDHAGAIGAAIDQVAEQDDGGFGAPRAASSASIASTSALNRSSRPWISPTA
jgi:hypothetical protein